MKKRKNGFTLAELLIVVAIIAVMVAIAIPMFTKQLEKSRESVDAANIRSQYAEVMSEAISSGADVNVDGLKFAKVDLKQKESGWQNNEFEKNLNSIAAIIDGSPHADGKAWVSISDGVVTIHYEGEGSGSGTGHSPMVSEAINKTKDDTASQILLSRIEDTLNDIISNYSTLDIKSVTNGTNYDLVSYKVKVAADGSYTIDLTHENTANLIFQPAALDREASKIVGSTENNSYDHYYVAVRRDAEGNICTTTNLAVKDGKIVTKQMNWRNYGTYSYITDELDNPEYISLKK